MQSNPLNRACRMVALCALSSVTFSACKGSPSRVPFGGGRVLSHPQVHIVSFGNTDGVAPLAALGADLAATAYWQEVTGEYGVGPITVGGPFQGDTGEVPAGHDLSDYQSLLRNHLDAADADWGPTNDDSVYTILMPTSVPSLPGVHDTACQQGITAWHQAAPMPLHNFLVPFVVVGPCNGAIDTIVTPDVRDQLTMAVSSAWIDAATDPEFTAFHTKTGEELADICDGHPGVVPPNMQERVAQSWSNTKNKCLPGDPAPGQPNAVVTNTPDPNATTTTTGGATDANATTSTTGSTTTGGAGSTSSSTTGNNPSGTTDGGGSSQPPASGGGSNNGGGSNSGSSTAGAANTGGGGSSTVTSGSTDGGASTAGQVTGGSTAGAQTTGASSTGTTTAGTTTAGGTSTAGSTTAAAPTVFNMLRIFTPSTGDHMDIPADQVGGGTSFSGDLVYATPERTAPGTVPLYRCVNTEKQQHMTTTDSGCEGKAGYVLDIQIGVIFTAQQSGTVPIYRCYGERIDGYISTQSRACEGADWLVYDLTLGYAYPIQ